MNCYQEDNPCCYVHPKEVVIGVCSLCLKEKLLILAAKQKHHTSLPKDTHKPSTILNRRPTIPLPRVFALGSFLHRLEPRPQKPANTDAPIDVPDDGFIASLDDSFISINLEREGQAKEGKGGRSMVEHPEQRGAALRWQKRIGHLLQLARWKRSSKAGVSCHGALAGKVEGGKGRRGWIRSLLRGRTTSTTE